MKNINKILIIGFALSLGLFACNKNEIKVKNYGKEIIGKWKGDSATYFYTDFNGIDKEFHETWDQTYAISYFEFNKNKSFYQTFYFTSDSTETSDYSPWGWEIEGEKLKMITPNSLRIDNKIKNLTSSSLELAWDISGTDTFYSNGIASGILKESIYYWSK